MHRWGDKNVDWKGINDVAQFIADYCLKYARLGGQYKEKFGEVRYYASGFGVIGIHQFLYPRHIRKNMPDWIWNLDVKYISPFLSKVLGGLWFRWQKFIYSRAYHKALKKWPHLWEEIVTASDYPEYIKGLTRQEGKKKHILGSKGEIIATWKQL